MGFLQRVRTVIAANLNALISKAEDPEKMLEQLILDMQKQFVDARKQVAAAMADEKRLKKQYENQERLAKEWEAKARKALLAGREDLARQALSRKAEHEKMAHEFKAQWEAQAQAVEQLRGTLQQLSAKIEEAKRKKNLLIARAKRAEAQKRIQETMSGLSDTSAFDAFARMEEKVEQKEAEAEVVQELAAGELGGGDQLEKEFAALEAQTVDTAADQELLKLKAELGLLEAPKKPEGLPGGEKK